MSNNIKLFNPPNEDEKNLYRPQIFHYKYNTCIEKPRSLEKYDPDTLKSLSNLMKSTKSVTRFKFQSPPPILKPSPSVVQSQQICPQWLKYDKICLRFSGYFDEHVSESAYENWKIRPCTFLYYLDDDTFHIIEDKYENSGMPQGNLLKRRRIDLEIPKKCPVDWRDINIGQNLYLYGKKFRICDCDKFTLEYYTRKGIVLNPPEKIPEIDYNLKYKDVDYNKVKKDIAELKEFTEASLGGGHPNGGLK